MIVVSSHVLKIFRKANISKALLILCTKCFLTLPSRDKDVLAFLIVKISKLLLPALFCLKRNYYELQTVVLKIIVGKGSFRSFVVHLAMKVSLKLFAYYLIWNILIFHWLYFFYPFWQLVSDTRKIDINLFVPNIPFLYPLENIRNLLVLWCFQGVSLWLCTLHIFYGS